jgi:hypothetical protein
MDDDKKRKIVCSYAKNHPLYSAKKIKKKLEPKLSLAAAGTIDQWFGTKRQRMEEYCKSHRISIQTALMKGKTQRIGPGFLGVLHEIDRILVFIDVFTGRVFTHPLDSNGWGAYEFLTQKIYPYYNGLKVKLLHLMTISPYLVERRYDKLKISPERSIIEKMYFEKATQLLADNKTIHIVASPHNISKKFSRGIREAVLSTKSLAELNTLELNWIGQRPMWVESKFRGFDSTICSLHHILPHNKMYRTQNGYVTWCNSCFDWHYHGRFAPMIFHECLGKQFKTVSYAGSITKEVVDELRPIVLPEPKDMIVNERSLTLRNALKDSFINTYNPHTAKIKGELFPLDDWVDLTDLNKGGSKPKYQELLYVLKDYKTTLLKIKKLKSHMGNLKKNEKVKDIQLESRSVSDKVKKQLSKLDPDIEIFYQYRGYQDIQDQLKGLLQKNISPSKFEKLTAALIGRLLDVRIVVAKSGFQFGGDAGPAGSQGRNFRIECKRYSDTTRLSARELLGEIDEALQRDDALEAWFLVSTRTVSEQISKTLDKHGKSIGVPVVIIDWNDNQLSPLAALCASAPDLVKTYFSEEASNCSKQLKPFAKKQISRLRKELQIWYIGFDPLRKESHEKLIDIWKYPRTSNSELGQDASGGAQKKKIIRKTIHDSLDSWWASSNNTIAVIGLEGSGKTWAVLNWLFDSKNLHPIILIIPSTSLAGQAVTSKTKVLKFLADRIYSLTGVGNDENWVRRLERLLKRPIEEKPVLTLLFDGLNQESTAPWLQLLRILQDEPFRGRVRVIVTTRNHYLENRLGSLKGLVDPTTLINVGPYDITPGGELDQMLVFENLTQADLHPEVVELARNPRLFNLVVEFREKLVNAGEITVHRLLWEYGRNTLGQFNESEVGEWIRERGTQRFNEKQLAELANRPDLLPKDIYSRLSFIIDGRFIVKDRFGKMNLLPIIVSNALGAGLLATLKGVTYEGIEEELNQWLDPISGLDERSEILRAAVSIHLAQKNSGYTPLLGVLVTAWLQAQNISDNHRSELENLAPKIPRALLDAVEHSLNRTHNSARFWAVNALRAIPKQNEHILEMIIDRLSQWFSKISLLPSPHFSENDKMYILHSDHFMGRIGTDSGSITVLGKHITVMDWVDPTLSVTSASIMEGYPLLKMFPIFEKVAITSAVIVVNGLWNRLKWLCLLNDVDPEETRVALKELSERILKIEPEDGINPELHKLASSLVLTLSGHEQDDNDSASGKPLINRLYSYEKDYLSCPEEGGFPLERRHAKDVLLKTDISLYSRILRVEDLWLDPTFDPPSEICIELETLFESKQFETYQFNTYLPTLARCAPDLLAKIMREKMQYTATCHPLLAEGAETKAAQKIRQTETSRWAVGKLLILEILYLDVKTQIDILIQADLDFFSKELNHILRTPTSEDVDALITRYATGSTKQRQDLLALLLFHPIKFSDMAWSWIEEYAKQENPDHIHIAFQTLTLSNAKRFGRTLLDIDWIWSPYAHLWVNHYGSLAIIQATKNLSFNKIIHRLAPWLLLRAAVIRGSKPEEVKLASELYGQVLTDSKIKDFDRGPDLVVRVDDNQEFSFNYNVPRNSPVMIGKLIDHSLMAKTRIKEARASGANLYLTNIDFSDFDPVLKYTPEVVDRWIDGYQEVTKEFQHRVRFADWSFIALCEALLIHDPVKGVVLWLALKKIVMVNYTGPGSINQLIHLIFRAPDSHTVFEVRDELLLLNNCSSDLELFDLAIAAFYNGKSSWLTEIIENDKASKLAWKRRRGLVLDGFTANNNLPIEKAWPDHQIKTSWDELVHSSARFRWSEACAHHWWRAFLNAKTTVDAYAAWVLFYKLADRRAWIWIYKDIETIGDNSELFKLKIKHFETNKRKLDQSMNKKTEKLKRRFLNRNITTGIGPWRK